MSLDTGHFVALAKRLTPPDVKVKFHNKGNYGRAFCEKREIYAPHPTTVNHLQVYLHELGHILHPHRENQVAEGEYQAEAYSYKTLRRAGIPLPRWIRKLGIAYVGWHVVNDLLMDRSVGAEARAFVGLRGVHHLTIIRAHFMALKRIGYYPKRKRYGSEGMFAPADRNYWAALLAAVPAAKRQTRSDIKQYEAEQQREDQREWRYAEDEEGNYWGRHS